MTRQEDQKHIFNFVWPKDLRLSAAAEINADLCRVADWGGRWPWHIEFEPSKSILFVCLLSDIEEHPPLFMNDVLIKELKVLRFHFLIPVIPWCDIL